MQKKERKLTPITDLFEKYKRTLKPPQGIVTDAFIEVIHDLLGLLIRKEQVKYTPSQKTLYVNVSGPLKTEIKLREGEVLTHLKGRLGAAHAPTKIL